MLRYRVFAVAPSEFQCQVKASVSASWQSFGFFSNAKAAIDCAKREAAYQRELKDFKPHVVWAERDEDRVVAVSGR